MKTKDVKVGKQYFCEGKIVTVVKRIKGGEKTSPQMHSGILFDGFHRKQKRFELDNGNVVKANKLSIIPITHKSGDNWAPEEDRDFGYPNDFWK